MVDFHHLQVRGGRHIHGARSPVLLQRWPCMTCVCSYTLPTERTPVYLLGRLAWDL